eukprot:NODE_3372_length_795_cov_239.171622.p1 GENE.NODE_3372_length_795_cov_239.171622~~NODE_3372_length_795_cov_239.171622.p1  ORF type:complete len:231 (-),score=72.54 NODE_3372_length_795_cov_239.171622:103-708(-)
MLIAPEQSAFLLVDYPGYGANDGFPPTPASVLTAQHAALKAALAHFEVPPTRLHLLGHSLGAAACAQFAASTPRGGGGGDGGMAHGRLVLSAPFTNIGAMARALFSRYVPVWLLRVLVSQRWQNDVWVPKAAKAGWNVRIIHGERDHIVPAWMGQELFKLAQRHDAQSSFREVPLLDHNEMLSTVDLYLPLMYPEQPRSRC